MPVRVSPVPGLSPASKVWPREAEVEQLHAMGGQKHVGGFQITMHDTARVHRRKCREDAETDRERL